MRHVRTISIVIGVLARLREWLTGRARDRVPGGGPQRAGRPGLAVDGYGDDVDPGRRFTSEYVDRVLGV